MLDTNTNQSMKKCLGFLYIIQDYDLSGAREITSLASTLVYLVH